MHNVRVTGHFGEFCQGILDNKSLGLISAPCPKLWVEIHNHGTGITLNGVRNDRFSQDITAIYQALDTPLPAALHAQTNMPLGGGAGFSSALRLAIIRHIFPKAKRSEQLAKMVKTEKAIDPLLFTHFNRLLWKSRDAKITAKLPQLPRMQIIGGFWGAPVYTDPKDINFTDIGDLISRWQKAEYLDDFAEISTESARRNIKLRGRNDDPIFELAKTYQAKGVVIAHTGSARGLIFEPDMAPAGVLAALHEAEFENTLEFQVGGRL